MCVEILEGISPFRPSLSKMKKGEKVFQRQFEDGDEDHIPSPARSSSLRTLQKYSLYIYNFTKLINKINLVNLFTYLLQILENIFKTHNLKPYGHSSKAFHTHICTHIHHKLISSLNFRLLWNLLKSDFPLSILMVFLLVLSGRFRNLIASMQKGIKHFPWRWQQQGRLEDI